MAASRATYPPPVFRRLRVFAVDPGVTARFETAVMNEMTARIPWEDLEVGPVGEYVEVVDADARGRSLGYAVDLNDPRLLARNGLPPSDGSGRFRHQMVYAVAMRTINNFERALGRPAHWAARADGSRNEYQSRISLHPHYSEHRDAHYEQSLQLVRFGYFRSQIPPDGPLVFTCLSQDAIAGEIVRALLAGLGIGLGDATVRAESEALREAFADIVAVLQHFGESDVLRHQVAAARGVLEQSSLLGAVALQVGKAMGYPDGVRNVFGARVRGAWLPRRPDPGAYAEVTGNAGQHLGAHARGEVLSGAVFEAFREIYEAQVADLRRIASNGTGVLPEGDLHPDLVARLTGEASELARHILQMCIRALDYLPPVDVSFSDYLRAIVTADHDLVPDDPRHYRIAFADAFRGYGIAPRVPGTVSVDTLRWRPPPRSSAALEVVSTFVRGLSRPRTASGRPGLARGFSYWTLPRDREERWRLLDGWRAALERRLRRSKASDPLLGDDPSTRRVRSLDIRERAGPAGTVALQWVIKIVHADGSAGATLLVDAESGEIRYLIAKPSPATGRDLLELAESSLSARPSERRLRVFALDPTVGASLDTAGINEVTLRVPWEGGERGGDHLPAGPVGEYLEVIDRDPASDAYYAPVDLDRTDIVAEDGLAPAEGDPQFHQQMVYAVAMRIISDFERALGRVVLWAPHRTREPGDGGKQVIEDHFVRRLRIYPHALREANAYYSPQKKALLFGYFPAPSDADGQVTVFTCLSHDIVAHEVTHALLDGIHQRFNDATNPDVLAFHEAFADIVALFERFSLPEVLAHQIAATRGDLRSQSRLGELAQQLGQAIGRRGALRSAIGEVDPETGEWRPRDPDPTAYRRVTEPHERGAILVAAIFEAFLTIYRARVADLLRIATGGTGVLPDGNLHPDLVKRLSDEAARSAQHVRDMCIRALDYMPPVDITFGDYLRAIVTADHDKDPVDDDHRRVAFAEAFRAYGIVPEDARTLSVDDLLWQPSRVDPEADDEIVLEEVKQWAVHLGAWGPTRDRKELFEVMARLRARLHGYLKRALRDHPESAVLRGIDPALPVEVHSIRPAMRTGWDGRSRFHWVIELTQRKGRWVDAEAEAAGADPDLVLRGGCTLIVEADSGKVLYSIDKPLDQRRQDRQEEFLLDEGDESLKATYFGGARYESAEPFAALHRY